MDGFLIPNHIWKNKNYNINQKLLLSVLYARRYSATSISTLSTDTGLNKQVVAKECLSLWRSGAPIERVKTMTDDYKVLTAYKYHEGLTGDWL